MKKIILKFWIINLLLSIILFYAYAFIIKETESNDCTWVENFFTILLILLEFYFKLVFLSAMVVCSITYFLNLIDKIRINYFYSFLTFFGLPLICVVFLLVNLLIAIYSNNESILKPILLLSIVYLIIATIEFLLFRKNITKFQIQKIENDEKNIKNKCIDFRSIWLQKFKD